MGDANPGMIAAARSTSGPVLLEPLAPRVAPDPTVSVRLADSSDPKRVGEYADDMMRHWKEEEGTVSAKGTSMASQTDINERFRGILVDWLVEVHLKFRMNPETLYLTVSIIDRFLERKSITRGNLQLVGIAAILLAAKYEEIYAPPVADLEFVSAKAYTRDEILKMESTILTTLKFQLTVPTAYPFMQRLLLVAEADEQQRNLANFYSERMLQEYGMLRHLPSTVAAAAVSLALRATGRAPWTSTLQHYSSYTEETLRSCTVDMRTVMEGSVTAQLQAVRKKYTSRCGGVAAIPLPLL